MSDQEKILEEEDIEKEETQTPPSQVEEPKTEPHIVEVKTPYEGNEFDLLVDLYAQKRGITEKNTAKIKLAKLLNKMDFNPTDAVADLINYTKSVNQILSTIPDTPFTEPIKTQIASDAAMRTAEKAQQIYFNDILNPDTFSKQFQKIQNMLINLKMWSKALDIMFGDEEKMVENKNNNHNNEEIKLLQKQIEELARQLKEKQKSELEEKIDLLFKEINELKTRQQEEKPKSIADKLKEIEALEREAEATLKLLGRKAVTSEQPLTIEQATDFLKKAGFKVEPNQIDLDKLNDILKSAREQWEAEMRRHRDERLEEEKIKATENIINTAVEKLISLFEPVMKKIVLSDIVDNVEAIHK